MIWLGASTALSKPMYIASIVWPTATLSTGCCASGGSWLRTELTLVSISVSALSASQLSRRLMVMVLSPLLLDDVM